MWTHSGIEGEINMAKENTPDAVSWVGSQLEWLRDLDPKVARFDDPEVEAMLTELSDLVMDIFGQGSAEFEKFHQYRICMGPWSMKDSSAEKQAKFEQGIPKAIKDFEELLEAVHNIQPASTEEPPPEPAKNAKTESGPAKKTEIEKKKVSDPARSQPPVAEPKAEKAAPPPKKAPEKPEEKEQVGESNIPAADKKTTAEIKALLLHSGDDEITVSVIDLLDKLGVDTVMPDSNQETSAGYMGEIAAISGLNFTIYLLNPDEKALFPGLPGKIAKTRPRQEAAYELGFLVGKLGKDRVAVLFRKEKGIDIPHDFFGVSYVPYDADGGWKINLIKLLKSAGFQVDANILFE